MNPKKDVFISVEPASPDGDMAVETTFERNSDGTITVLSSKTLESGESTIQGPSVYKANKTNGLYTQGKNIARFVNLVAAASTSLGRFLLTFSALVYKSLFYVVLYIYLRCILSCFIRFVLTKRVKQDKNKTA